MTSEMAPIGTLTKKIQCRADQVSDAATDERSDERGKAEHGSEQPEVLATLSRRIEIGDHRERHEQVDGGHDAKVVDDHEREETDRERPDRHEGEPGGAVVRRGSQPEHQDGGPEQEEPHEQQIQPPQVVDGREPWGEEAGSRDGEREREDADDHVGLAVVDPAASGAPVGVMPRPRRAR